MFRAEFPVRFCGEYPAYPHFLAVNELAKRIDLTDSNLSIMKTGKARAVRVSTLDALCRELNCQPGDLMEYSPDEKIEDVRGALS